MKQLTLRHLLRGFWERFKVCVDLLLTAVSKGKIIYGEGLYCNQSARAIIISCPTSVSGING